MDDENASSDLQTVKISLPWTWQPVKRRMLPGCEFFRDGDVAMHLTRKLIPLENDKEEAKTSDKEAKEEIPCSVIGCVQTFTSLLSYENHYKSAHCHSCLTCRRTFPSAHLLDVHIQENHDPLFAVLATRQDMYQCLVESCGLKFPGPDTRRKHLIHAHSYPANFRFHLLRPAEPRPKKKPAQSVAATGDMDIDKPSPSVSQTTDTLLGDTDKPSTPLDSCSGSAESPSDKENAVAAARTNAGQGSQEGKGGEEGMEVSEAEKQAPLRIFVHKVPLHFSFGYAVGRGFQHPPGKKKAKKKGAHWHQRVGNSSGETTTTNIENVDMRDMADALSDTL